MNDAAVVSLSPETVLGEMKKNGVTHVVWLPDSETGFMYQAILQSPIALVPVCREGESMAIAFAGCVGLLLALVAIPQLSRALAGLLPPLLVTAKTLVYGVIASLMVGFASGILPAYGAMRMRVVNALRRV